MQEKKIHIFTKYLKIFFLSIFFFQASLFSSEYSIVFIHIGPKIPAYTEVALSQARLFNPNCPIYLIANQEALNCFKADSTIQFIPQESLKKTPAHLKFQKTSSLKQRWRGGFWRYTSERFLYLDDFVQEYGLKNVFHLENDVMLYVDLETLLPVFESYYPTLGATFDNDNRCVPGFIYAANSDALSTLSTCFASYAKQGLNDMQIFDLLKQKIDSAVNFLPIVPKEYVDQRPMISTKGYRSSDKRKFHQHCDLFQSIFDAAAIGQYLGGVDPTNGISSPGFINELCLFNPSDFMYEFREDHQGRKVPYATFDNTSYRINNLHIHSKNLAKFKSYE